MAVELRSARPADRPSLKIIRQQAIEAAYGDQFDRSAVAALVAESPVELRAWIGADRHAVSVIQSSVTQVGYAAAAMDSGEVRGPYIAPDYADRGYGSRVLAAIEETLAEAGVETAWICAPEPAIPFFERSGYERSGKTRADRLPRARVEKSLEGLATGE